MPRVVALGLALAALAPPAAAQAVVEWQAHALATWATQSLVGGGVGLALRSPGRERAALTLTAARENAALAGRAELLGSYYLNPERRRGLTAYAAAGLAVVRAQGTWGEDLVVLLGVESRPAAPAGWFLEAGVGGGVRAAAGVRLRHHPTGG